MKSGGSGHDWNAACSRLMVATKAELEAADITAQFVPRRMRTRERADGGEKKVLLKR